MAEFHFVEDYERHVADLIAKHPIDEAMSLAVGGDYEGIGRVMAQALITAGLKDGDSVVDIGCGSGRVASAVAKRVNLGAYLGTDVVEALLSYARTKCPDYYNFVNNRQLYIPIESDSVDYVFAFSLFTHLLPEECYMYLRDAYRVLKPGGLFLFTYHDISNPEHRSVFHMNVRALEANQQQHLNSFINMEMIDFWISLTGFVKDDRPLQQGWQSSILLRKPGMHTQKSRA